MLNKLMNEYSHWIAFAAMAIVGMMIPPITYAQEPATEAAKPEASAAVKALDADGDGKVSADELKAVAGPVDAADETPGELGAAVSDAAALAKEASSLKDALKGEDRQGKLLALAAFLAGLSMLLLRGLRLLAKNTTVFKGKQGKATLKYATVALGCLAGIAANFTLGLSLPESLMIAFGAGPGAIALHEYAKDSKETAEDAPSPDTEETEDSA